MPIMTETAPLDPVVEQKIEDMSANIDAVIAAHDESVATIQSQIDSLKAQRQALNEQIAALQKQIDDEMPADVRTAKAMKKVGDMIRSGRPLPPIMQGFLR